MDWNAYTIFGIATGGTMIAVGFSNWVTGTRHRFTSPILGAALIAYSIYAGTATSGVFVFPVVIFVYPFAMLGLAGAEWYWKRHDAPATESVEVTRPVTLDAPAIEMIEEPKTLDRRCVGVSCSRYFVQVWQRDCVECGWHTQLHAVTA